LYRTRKAGVVRSSIDFWPEHADSHGQHAHTNAVFSLWFGEFVWPDWDMFQTAHLAGAYHAALRAVSGSSLCIADAPGHHDFDLLRKLLTRSGQTLRAEQPGVPTRDSLFADVREGPNLLKIWNQNRHSGVVGLFNARREPDRSAKGWLAAHDVPTLQGNAFALYFHQSRALVRASKRARCAVSLSALQWEVVTIVPIVAGFAPIGLTDKLNSGASIKHVNSSPGICRFGVVDDGPVLVWCARKPREVQVDGRKHAVWSYENHALSLDISSPGEHRVVIVT
jgi:raffinose synthase